MSHDDSLLVVELAPGLWRWRALPSPCARGDVWSVYCETEAGIVLVDPVLPPEGSADHDRFFRALDRDVARLGAPVIAVATCDEHARDLGAIRARYGASQARPYERIAPDAILLSSHGVLVTGHGAASPPVTGIITTLPSH